MEQVLTDLYKADNKTIIDYCDTYLNGWENIDSNMTFGQNLKYCIDKCGLLEYELANGTAINDKFQNAKREVATLKKMLENKGLNVEMSSKHNLTLMQLFENLFSVLEFSKDALINEVNSHRATKLNYDSCMLLDRRLAEAQQVEVQSPVGILFRYALNQLFNFQYRRHGKGICVPLYTFRGHFTHCYKYKYDIEEFIHQLVSKETRPDMWQRLYELGNESRLSKFLTVCYEPEFPDLVANRTVFAFDNGIYCADTHKFYEYGISQLPVTVVACKYFKMNFEYAHDTTQDWYNLPTPAMQSILDPHFKNEKEYHSICRLAYILLGRMLYNLGVHDDWQVMPLFKGGANTGKSTILKNIAKKFYNPEHVGILSNDCSDTFPLENLYDKFIWVSLDIDERMRLPQMTFQSMISGEDVSISRKHKTPIDMEWECPGAMSTNSLFGYHDNGGSIARRAILFEFNKILTPDEIKFKNLEDKLHEEMPMILQKCNLAYRKAVEIWPRQNLWDHVPQYFRDNRDELFQQTNALMNFLGHPNVVYGADEFISQDDFVAELKNFNMKNGFITKTFNKQYYSIPFATMSQKKNVQINVHNTVRDDNNRMSGRYITGIDIRPRHDHM